MTRFTFAGFDQNDENREACELCQAIASLQPVKPLPLLLIGPSGSGKTHLLCSVVNHVREHAPRTALAYVTAKEFPEAVRALAKEAGPVVRARWGMLLVDQFEKFPADLLGVLDGVASLFLRENRYLVIASQTHPEKMPDVPPRLANLIRSGRTLYLARPDASSASDGSGDPLEILKQENEVLRHELELARAAETQLAQAKTELEGLREQLADQEAERPGQLNPSEVESLLADNNILEQEVRSLQRALDETRKQRDACQGDAAALGAANAELARLRKQLDSAATVPGAAAADRIRALEEELQQARQAEQNAQADLDRWALRAQAMIQQLELNRARFAQTEAGYQQAVIDLQQRLADLAARGQAAPPD